MIIIMVSGKTQPESFYVILRRSGTKKKGRYISPLEGYIPKKEEINRFEKCSTSQEETKIRVTHVQ